MSSSPSHGSVFDRLGLAEVDITSLDLSDNPMVGSFGKGGTTQADYRWAVETWHSVVQPAVAGGADRSHFEERDRGEAAPLRRTADVYDLFLGTTDRIVVSTRPDGGLNVINGRHRLAIARGLGIGRFGPGESVSRDPLRAVVAADQLANERLARQLEDARSGWSDRTRRDFDSRGTRTTSPRRAVAALAEITQVADDVRGDLTKLEGA